MSQADPMPEHFIPARIESIEQATPLIRVFNLVTDPARFSARAGQWIDLAISLPSGTVIGGYSVVSAPNHDGHLQLAIKFADHHPATLHLHTRSRAGDEVFVTSGQGPFVFEKGMGREVVLLGAGIGVTPLISILRYISKEMDDVNVHLVYSVASRREVLFAEELAALARSPRVGVTLTITREAEDWLGHTGRISHPLLESLRLPREALYYYCGSRDFIEDMTQLLRDWGIPEPQLRYEKWW